MCYSSDKMSKVLCPVTGTYQVSEIDPYTCIIRVDAKHGKIGQVLQMAKWYMTYEI